MIVLRGWRRDLQGDFVLIGRCLSVDQGKPYSRTCLEKVR